MSSSVSLVEVNLAALDHNLALLQRLVGPDCGVGAILKADGYGIGATAVGRRLARRGADMLVVFSPDEAEPMLEQVPSTPLLVLMPVRQVAERSGLARSLAAGRAHLTVHDETQLDDLVQVARRLDCRLGVHLAIDTGMSRGGCTLEEAGRLLGRIHDSRLLTLTGLFTHFASADRDPAFTSEQMTRFDECLTRHRALVPSDCVVHMANTFATLSGPRYHRQMIRVGLAWAGYGVEMMRHAAAFPEAAGLRPCVSWLSQIVHMKTIKAGTGVGYGATWTAPRETVIGLVPVGYADGYPISLGGPTDRSEFARITLQVKRGEVVQRFDAPVVGAVSMDQITVDLTDVVRATGALEAGTPVELISPDPDAPNRLTHVAELARTSPHVFLCGINPRVKRVYVDRGAVIETKPVQQGIRQGGKARARS